MAGSFSHQTSALLDQAASACEQRGVRLTELRRDVLGFVLDSEKPSGAYDILDRLRSGRRGAAPPTVYRALDFLLEQGLIHKVERLSAFIGCIHPAETRHHHHVGRFLICTRCGRVNEVEDPSIDRALSDVTRAAGFVPHNSTVEVVGLCADCAMADPDPVLRTSA